MSIRVRIVADCFVEGRPRQIGDIVAVAPAVAHDLCGWGRAELVDPADAPSVREALHADVARILRKLGPPPRMERGDPWITRRKEAWPRPTPRRVA